MTDSMILQRLQEISNNITVLSMEIASYSEQTIPSNSVRGALYYSNLEQLLERAEESIELILDKHRDSI